MPTPQPGTYVYPPNPPGIVPGHPEVFTHWPFAFNLIDGRTGSLRDSTTEATPPRPPACGTPA